MKKIIMISVAILLAACTQAPQNPNFDKNVELAKNGSKLSHLKILKVFQILWLMMLSGEAVFMALP